ncbi:MAG TPA: hypothetical protein VGP47_05050 [Parachlamydiaceae bacterium]|nr:hypothetical protein [Parachlamydiaceae bacterium]
MNSINPYSNTNQNMHIYEYSDQPLFMDEYDNDFTTQFELQNLHPTELQIERLSQRLQNIISKWFSASGNRKDTTQRIKLYEKTDLIIKDLTKICIKKEYGNVENLHNLINTFKNEFYKHTKNDSEALAKWIASNSSQAGGTSLNYVVGAYSKFHQLCSVKYMEQGLLSTSNSMDIIEAEESRGIEYILKTSANYMDEMKNDAPFIVDDVQKYIFSYLNLNDLINTQKTSMFNQRIVDEIIKENLKRFKLKDLIVLKESCPHNEMLVLPEIIERLNSEKININELKYPYESFNDGCRVHACKCINSVDDLIDYFGNCVDQVFNLDLSEAEFSTINTIELDDIAENFTNLKRLKLGREEGFGPLLNEFSSLTSLCIKENDLFSFENILQNCPNLTKLECVDFDYSDFKVLDKCSFINEIEFNQYTLPTSNLREMKCNSLKKISFYNFDYKLDFDLFLNFPQLSHLNLNSMEINSYCELPNITHLTITNCSLIGFNFDPKTLEKFPNLKKLVTDKLSQFSTFTQCSSLTDLKLINFNMEEISFLKNNPNIKNLTLESNYCRVQFDKGYCTALPLNISELNECLSLETLQVDDCKIEDFGVLVNHPSLKKLILNDRCTNIQTAKVLEDKGIEVIVKKS